MKNVKQVTTAPYSRLGFQSQVLNLGDTVEVYNAITCKVSFTGKIRSLTIGNFVTGGNMRGCIVCDNGDIHEANGLQTAKKIAQ
jgi:hypothetical protein